MTGRGVNLILSSMVMLACAPTMPPPAPTSHGYLGRGVLAQADLEAGTITVCDDWADLPRAVRILVLAHEGCHLRGHIDEADADCCAASAVAEVWGAATVLEAAAWLQAHGRDPMALMECAR